MFLVFASLLWQTFSTDMAYWVHDSEFLIDMFKSNLSYLRHNWGHRLGRPIYVIPIFEWVAGLLLSCYSIGVRLVLLVGATLLSLLHKFCCMVLVAFKAF